jgi:hypothetical protein
MKKIVYLLPAALIMFACGSEEESQETSTDNNSNDVATDTLSVDSIATEEVAEGVFETVEDYTTITSKTALYEAFAEDDLIDGESWYAEGTVKFETTTVNNPTNKHTVIYVWDRDNNEDLSSIEFHASVYDEGFNVTGTQEIKSTTGIYTGMPLKDLEEWNGAPFEFSGFGWDFAGGISRIEGTKIEQSPFGIRLDITYNDDTYQMHDALIGDVQWMSDAPETEGAPIHLGTITYWMP